MEKPIIVAELSINHLGMVNIAKKMIDSAVECGANLIKLKCKNVKKYYKSDGKKWRNFNFKEYRQSLELSRDDFKELAEYCNSKGIDWFCTVHDTEGLEFIRSFKPPFYKVASMDAGKSDFVDEVISSCKSDDKPLIISLGGKDDEFTDALVSKISNSGIKAFLLHTVSIYPTPAGKSNINYILKLIKKYSSENIKIGYSGHEVGFSASLMAAVYGAQMIERHFSLSRDFKIHHIEAALIPDEFRQMTNMIDEIFLETTTSSESFNPEELKFLVDRVYT